jgi:hypothetical protein
VRELRQLLASEGFTTWYRRFDELRQTIAAARQRHDEFLAEQSLLTFQVDTLQRAADEAVFGAGELDERAAQAQGEVMQHDNTSFAVLGAYEEQRLRATASWEMVDELDERLFSERRQGSDIQARMAAAERSRLPESVPEVERLLVRQRENAQAVSQLVGELEAARTQLKTDEAKKSALWQKEQEVWVNVFRASMARAELGYQAARTRREAERLFARAEVARRRLLDLNAEAESTARELADQESALRQHLEDGRKQLGCALVAEILYWPHEADMKTALCVPLITEREHFNVQVTPLSMYKIEVARGLERLEPIGAEALGGEIDDPRLAAFFAR